MSLRLNEKAYLRIEELVTEVCEREGCYLYDIEYVGGSRGKGKKLRIFIDKDAENGVSIDDCANVSRGVSLLLDVEDEVVPEGAYELEVSSPGLERKLSRPWHFEKAIGKTVKVRVTQPFAEYNDYPKLKNRMSAQGVLNKATEEAVNVKVQDMDLEVPIGVIQRANVVFEFEKNNQK